MEQRIGQRAALDGGSRPLEVDAEKVAAAAVAGDQVFAKASACFQAKDFKGAVALVNDARSLFATAGDGGALARGREKVLGNLYAVALVELERGARVEKLLELKKLNDLVKLKRQAELFGVDWEEFKQVAGIN